MSLRLLRLPSGGWSLVAVPDAQHLTTERRSVSREEVRAVRLEVRGVPFLSPFPAAGGAR